MQVADNVQICVDVASPTLERASAGRQKEDIDRKKLLTFATESIVSLTFAFFTSFTWAGKTCDIFSLVGVVLKNMEMLISRKNSRPFVSL